MNNMNLGKIIINKDNLSISKDYLRNLNISNKDLPNNLNISSSKDILNQKNSYLNI